MSANLKFIILNVSLVGLFNFTDIKNAVASAEVGRSTGTTVNTVSALHSPQLQSNFISTCLSRGIREQFCRQITSPNTDSIGTFRQVYGNKPFVLMPSQDRWETGLHLLTIAESLAEYGKICEIRNWYRPEPYNRAVSGAKGSQHLSAGAIDIEFCSVAEKNNALKAALAMRQKYGSPPGVGVYGEGSLVIHIDMSNRIYGRGIEHVDRFVARESAWANVSRPGSNLKPRSGFLSASSSSSPGTAQQPIHNDITEFFRQILSIFTPKN